MTAPTTAPAAPTAPTGVVHSLAYTRYAGARRSPAFTPLVIARYALTTQLRQRGVKIILLLGLMLFAVVAAVSGFYWTLPAMMAEHGAGAADLARLADSVRTGESQVATFALKAQFIPTFLLVLWCGAGAISADLVAGAFQFHFARPVSPLNYLAGRMLSSAGWALALASTMVGVLSLERLAFRSTPFGAARAASVGFVAVLLYVTALSAVALGVSSVTRRKGLAQAMFAALVLGSYPLSGGVGLASETRWIRSLDPYSCVSDGLAQFEGTLHLDGAARFVPALAWLAWTALPLALAAWKLSRAEVNRG